MTHYFRVYQVSNIRRRFDDYIEPDIFRADNELFSQADEASDFTNKLMFTREKSNKSRDRSNISNFVAKKHNTQKNLLVGPN